MACRANLNTLLNRKRVFFFAHFYPHKSTDRPVLNKYTFQLMSQQIEP
jgi:hypothetical protein